MAPGKIPESVLKKRKRAEDWAAKRQATRTDFKNKAKANRKEIFQRAEKYVKEYRTQVGTAGKYVSVSGWEPQSSFAPADGVLRLATTLRARLMDV